MSSTADSTDAVTTTEGSADDYNMYTVLEFNGNGALAEGIESTLDFANAINNYLVYSLANLLLQVANVRMEIAKDMQTDLNNIMDEIEETQREGDNDGWDDPKYANDLQVETTQYNDASTQWNTLDSITGGIQDNLSQVLQGVESNLTNFINSVGSLIDIYRMTSQLIA